jgi:hypothetical protein
MTETTRLLASNIRYGVGRECRAGQRYITFADLPRLRFEALRVVPGVKKGHGEHVPSTCIVRS